MKKFLFLLTVVLVLGATVYCLRQYQQAPLGGGLQPQTPFQKLTQSNDVPADFEQLLPRGGIPAINDPQYVSADEAEISDDAYVLGVVIEDQPVAYSLNLLNSHEVVNDTIGETNFAAVW